MYDDGRWSGWIAFKNMVDHKLKTKDIPQDVAEWAKEAQAWVVEKGISDGERPRDPVTRQEVWTMLHRALGK